MGRHVNDKGQFVRLQVAVEVVQLGGDFLLVVHDYGRTYLEGGSRLVEADDYGRILLCAVACVLELDLQLCRFLCGHQHAATAKDAQQGK